MGYKVISTFRDKFTKKLYEKGGSYNHEDEKRIAFLIEKGFLEGPKKEEPKKKSAKKADKK